RIRGTVPQQQAVAARSVGQALAHSRVRHGAGEIRGQGCWRHVLRGCWPQVKLEPALEGAVTAEAKVNAPPADSVISDFWQQVRPRKVRAIQRLPVPADREDAEALGTLLEAWQRLDSGKGLTTTQFLELLPESKGHWGVVAAIATLGQRCKT